MPARFDREGMVRYHMRRHFDDLRAIEQLLVSGKLDEAKARAFLLAQPETDPGMAPWEPRARGVVEAVRALRMAPNIDEACRREARVAEACAECHLEAQQPHIFGVPSTPPPERATTAARMARHQWGVDQLWAGLVGPSDEHWRAGLAVLAESPAPPTWPAELPALGARLQELARRALPPRATETLDDRAAVYGEMLVTCAACHSPTFPAVVPRSRSMPP